MGSTGEGLCQHRGGMHASRLREGFRRGGDRSGDQTPRRGLRAGLAPLTGGEVDCPFEFPDLETALRGHMSTGVAAVQQVIAESLAPFRLNGRGYCQRNRFRYVIALA